MSTTDAVSNPTEQSAWREPEWCRAAKVGRTTMWKEIKIGRVKAKKCGRATLIVTSPRQWLESLPDLAA